VTHRTALHPSPQIRRASQLRHSRRLISRVADVLKAMQAGQLLHFEHRALWSLSDGTAVAAVVADLITHNAAVAPTGDSLFPILCSARPGGSDD
jgi:hypothetical protein